jgi:hypothetical protein
MCFASVIRDVLSAAVAEFGTTVAHQRRDVGKQRSLGPTTNPRIYLMLWTLAVILLILWALGFLAFHVGGGLIHLLLVIALIVIVYRLVTGRRPVV